MRNAKSDKIKKLYSKFRLRFYIWKSTQVTGQLCLHSQVCLPSIVELKSARTLLILGTSRTSPFQQARLCENSTLLAAHDASFDNMTKNNSQRGFSLMICYADTFEEHTPVHWCQRILFVFDRASRQWRRGNVALITTLPVVQHLQPRCLEDRFLPHHKEKKHC